MRIASACLALVFVAACGEHHSGHLADAGNGSGIVGQIVVTPADATLMVTDNVAVLQPYTAMLMQDDGTATDVTNLVNWSLVDSSYGAFAGATLSVNGGGAGPSQLFATMTGAATGKADFTVYVHGHRVEGSLPTDGSVPGLFGAATEDPTRAPTVVYPAESILVPPNLGQFDVHWADATGNDTWEVAMSNEYIDLHIYTQGLDPARPIYTLFNPSEWYPIASTKSQLTLTVTGLQLANPTTKGTAAAQHVDVTNENAKGGIYYWSTTSNNEGIFRYDVGTPEVPPALYAGQTALGACVGCHALSRDGTKMAVTFDGDSGRGTVINVADLAVQIPYADQATALHWNFAAFTADASKLVTVLNGAMTLRDPNTGADLADIPAAPADGGGAYHPDHPEVSPDNTMLVDVESHDVGTHDPFISGGQIMLRSYDGNVTFGAPTVLVPDTDGLGKYYPSFSPDGQWVAYTVPRAGGTTYNNASAETWVMKTDGTVGPIRLDAADLDPSRNLTNSWARWVPFGVTFGPTSEPMFYLTFSSERPFGVRIPNGGQPQIWMTPFFPARAVAGTDPSGPSFRVPFQDVTTANHIAQWTQAVVPIQ